MSNESFVLLTKRWIAWGLLNLSPKAFRTFTALQFFYSPTTQKAWPTLAILSHYTGYSRTTLGGSIKELIEKGVITREKHGSIGRFNNVYYFQTVEKGKFVPPAHEMTDAEVKKVLENLI
jgi:predicted transcriptional regulator